MSDTVHSGDAFLRFLIRWFVFCGAMVTRAKLQIRHRPACISPALRSPAFWVRQGAGRARCAIVGMARTGAAMAKDELKFQSQTKTTHVEIWAAYSASAARIAWKSRHANRFSSGVRSR